MPGYQLIRTTIGKVARPLWEELRRAETPLSVAELHQRCAAHPNAIQLRLKRWERAGLVICTASAPRRFIMPEGAADQPPTVNRAGVVSAGTTLQDRLWRAMRGLRRFSLPELCLTAGVGRRSAESFINLLTRAGYADCLLRGNSRTGVWSVYLLRRGAGPKTPVIRHRQDGDRVVKLLHDPNTGRDVAIAPRWPARARRASNNEVNHVA
jgi:hypothetical protein